MLALAPPPSPTHLSDFIQEENLSHVSKGDLVAGIHKMEVCTQ